MKIRFKAFEYSGDDVVDGVRFQVYFHEEAAPVLRKDGCEVEDTTGTELDYHNRVDTILRCNDLESLVDLCLNADKKRQAPARLETRCKTTGLISPALLDYYRKGIINHLELLQASLAAWEKGY